MSWQPELDDIARRKLAALEHGGPEKVARHKAAGKLLVRERIAQLLDVNSFREVGSISGFAQYNEQGELTSFSPSNVICGRGTINGRVVFVTGDDFTVRGGANDGGVMEKFVYAETTAVKLQVPLVRLIDGTGGGGSVKHLETMGRTYLPDVEQFTAVLDALSEVPIVALALGSVAGMGAARVVASHYSVMVQGSSQLFAAGPPVVERTGITIDKETLGGSHVHQPNGTVDDVVSSEAQAFSNARQFLSYLPQSVHQLATRNQTIDAIDRREELLLSAIPRKARSVYKVRPILKAVVDRQKTDLHGPDSAAVDRNITDRSATDSTFFEIGHGWGKSVVTGLARINGWPVALLASDPYHYGGAWTADTARKVVRFVDLAQTFQLPLIHFVDIPGFLIGPDAEQSGVMRFGTQALTAIRQCTVPNCAIMIRKAYGMAALSQRNGSSMFMRYAWPSANWGSLPIAGGVDAAYKAVIQASPDPQAKRAEIEAKLTQLQSPIRTAEAFGVEEIIDPRDTRKLLCEFVELAAPLRKAGRPTFGYRP
jgi:acetyl-CoA carboxylase carboxyltransferase component